MSVTFRFRRLSGLAVLAGLLAAACTPEDTNPAPQPDFHTRLTTTEVMAHVIDPAAWGLWGRAGTITNEEGETSLTPDTEEEWAAAENEAAIVAEAGNLLLYPRQTISILRGPLTRTDLKRAIEQRNRASTSAEQFPEEPQRLLSLVR